jgi:hypothetical protein
MIEATKTKMQTSDMQPPAIASWSNQMWQQGYNFLFYDATSSNNRSIIVQHNNLIRSLGIELCTE